VASAGRTTDIMNELAAASEEQSTGIGQVNTAITQMDEVTQQNAALVEQASAAAQSLAQQAQALRDAVSVFNVESDSPRAAVQSPRTARLAADRLKTPAQAASRRTTAHAVPAGASAPAVAVAADEADNWQTF